MLDFIRSNSQSLGVKLAFGIIILVFVFWGVGSMQSMSPATLVASVNDEPISIIAFERAYMQAREDVRRNNPDITPAQLAQMQLPQQVLQQLILASLLQQEAKRLDLVVAPAELRMAIEQIPAFQNAEGGFDPELYKRLVNAQGQRLSEFENALGNQLLEGKLRRDVTITGEAFDSEVAAFFNFTYEQRDVEYLFFPAEDAVSKLSPPAEDSLNAYYESNRGAFSLPAKASIDYILVSPTTVVTPESITAEAIAKYYESNKDKFTTQPRAKVRHILLTVEPTATPEDVEKITAKAHEILKELKNGADFAALAKKHSQDTTTAVNGGDLDWVNPGDTVPTFNDAVFSMKAGDISEPVRSEFGVHIIKVDEFNPAATKALAEVEADIRTELAGEQGAVKLREVLDNLIEANILGKNLADAAKAQNLELKRSELLPAFELEKLLQISPQGSAQILATSAGVPLDAALTAENNTYIVARVIEKTDATTRPFAEVKDEIFKILQETNALEEATRVATELRKNIDTATDLKPKLIAGVQRDADVGVLGSQPTMNTALFDAEEGAWLPTVYDASVDGKRGAVLVRVTKIKDSQDAQLGAMQQIIANVLAMQRKEKMFQLFLASLSEKADIEILNEQYLNMVSEQ